jgi:alpha-L-fucosidase 2
MDGDRADKVFDLMLRQEGFENLLTFQHAGWSNGRPDLFREPDNLFLNFQLDASGSTPGFMAEMLLQSHLGEIILLPALPNEWKNGAITGLKARGNYSVDIWWEKGELKKATISGNTVKAPKIRVVDTLIDPEKDSRVVYLVN